MTQADAASWLSAFGTIAAVIWGVWQVRGDRRLVRNDQRSAIHEISAAAEAVATSWDKLADLSVQPTGTNEISIKLQRYQLAELAEALDRLMQRRDLTDGTVLCGVRAKQLAEQMRSVVDYAMGEQRGSSYLQAALQDIEMRAQNALDSARALRLAHNIDPPRRPYRYITLRAPA